MEHFTFGSNFKMHKTLAEVRAFVQFLSQMAEDEPTLQLFILPPFTALGGLQGVSRPRNLWLGAQNMHWARSGPFTGEISAPMLLDLGVDLVMLGHAERRHTFGETNGQIRRKVESAVRHSLRMLLCVGETAAQRQAGITEEVLAVQLKVALSAFPPERAAGLMLAYEPVWAIGKGSREAQPEEIAPAIDQIREFLRKQLGGAAALTPVLYGGSVDEHNCSRYMEHTALDGLFVGRAAWQPEGFVRVLEAASHGRYAFGPPAE